MYIGTTYISIPTQSCWFIVTLMNYIFITVFIKFSQYILSVYKYLCNSHLFIWDNIKQYISDQHLYPSEFKSKRKPRNIPKSVSWDTIITITTWALPPIITSCMIGWGEYIFPQSVDLINDDVRYFQHLWLYRLKFYVPMINVPISEVRLNFLFAVVGETNAFPSPYKKRIRKLLLENKVINIFCVRSGKYYEESPLPLSN